jgi:hypothetical protein
MSKRSRLITRLLLVINMGNITSYFTPTRRLARIFRKLTPYEIDALVIKAVQDDPTKQVHYILLSDSSMNHPHQLLTKQQITLAFDECYKKIRTNTLMENMTTFLCLR